MPIFLIKRLAVLGVVAGACLLSGCVTAPYEAAFAACDNLAGDCYRSCEAIPDEDEEAYQACQQQCKAEVDACFSDAYGPYRTAAAPAAFYSPWYGRFGSFYPNYGYALSFSIYNRYGYRRPFGFRGRHFYGAGRDPFFYGGRRFGGGRFDRRRFGGRRFDGRRFDGRRGFQGRGGDGVVGGPPAGRRDGRGGAVTGRDPVKRDGAVRRSPPRSSTAPPLKRQRAAPSGRGSAPARRNNASPPRKAPRDSRGRQIFREPGRPSRRND